MLPFAKTCFYFLFIETARTDREIEIARAEAAQLEAVVEAGYREVWEQEEELLAMISRERAARARRIAMRAERQASTKPYQKGNDDTKKDKA